MNTTTEMTISKTDIECRGPDVVLGARLYQPGQAGVFPGLVSVHGGAWTSGDRTNNEAIDTALAAAGAVVLAIDFRLAPAAPYPAPVADINFAIRWLKAHAADAGTRPDWVGALGASSGGHQMLLNALLPRDAQYAALNADATGDADATVAFAIACWPISDPLARYRMAKERGNGRLVAAHDAFFGSEAAMEEANPQRLLERGAAVRLPPLLLLQGTMDDNVTPDMAERFASAYRTRGGAVTLEYFPDQPHTFVTKDPTSAASRRAIDLITRFALARGQS